MFWGAIASFILAAIMAALTGLGFWHAARTPQEQRMFREEPTLATARAA